MPIAGLTDQQARLPRLGIIRKGSPKQTKTNKEGKEYQIQGKDLDYFRLDTEDPEVQKAFIEAYGVEPKELRCLLPYETVDECFPAWMEEWAASSLKRRCDGVEQHLHLTPKNTYSKTKIKCVCDPDEPKCKASGRLHILLPRIRRFGYFEVETHSKWDISTIAQNLQAVAILGHSLQGRQMLLSRKMRSIPCPLKGKRVRQNKSLLQIEIDPDTTQRFLARVEDEAERLIVGNKPPALPQAETITEEQRRSIVATSGKSGLSATEAKTILSDYGYSSSSEVLVKDYGEIMQVFEDAGRKSRPVQAEIVAE